MLAQEKQLSMPDLLIMVYPAAENGHGFMDIPVSDFFKLDLTVLENRAELYNRLYTDDSLEVQAGPYCDFLNAPEELFRTIPDAILVTAGKDPLHFGAEKLPSKLLASGKSLSMRRFPESSHGFYVRCLGNEWKAARDYVLDLIAVRYGVARRDSQK